VAPTPINTSVPSFNLRAQKGKKPRCRSAHNQTTDLVLFQGQEVYVCLVQEQALLLISDKTPTVRVSLESEKDEIAIDAALWPWHSRAIHHTVANTCMSKNVECGKDLLLEGSQPLLPRMDHVASHARCKIFFYLRQQLGPEPSVASGGTYLRQTRRRHSTDQLPGPCSWTGQATTRRSACR
jgi:hypothetical protein